MQYAHRGLLRRTNFAEAAHGRLDIGVTMLGGMANKP